MLKGIGSLIGLMKNAGELRGKMEAMQEELARRRVEGTSGGGMVTAEANAQQKLLSVRFDPDLLASGDREMLEDLVVAAVNQAMEKARVAAAEEMQKVAEIPGLGEMLSKFGGESSA